MKSKIAANEKRFRKFSLNVKYYTSDFIYLLLHLASLAISNDYQSIGLEDNDNNQVRRSTFVVRYRQLGRLRF